MSTRLIAFLTGARSEYDLITPVIRAVDEHELLKAEVIVTASHLSPFHGMGINQVVADGFTISAALETLFASESWQGRALSFSSLAGALTRHLAAHRPDILFVTGDREEPLAGALVGNFLQIPVAHAHGGDRCLASDIDEVLRPALSKLAHLHFTATEGHRDRLIRMGELPHHVWATGAPGLDRLRTEPDIGDTNLLAELHIDPKRPFFLFIMHPSPTLNADDAGSEVASALEGILSLGHPVLCSYPNSDPGNVGMRQAIDLAQRHATNLYVHHSLSRTAFVSAYRRCAAIVGNSSSIVLESGYMKVPGVLVGPRQNLRETGPNVIRVGVSAGEVREACLRCLEDDSFKAMARTAPSLYGDGYASEKIAEILAHVSLDGELLRKVMPY